MLPPVALLVLELSEELSTVRLIGGFELLPLPPVTYTVAVGVAV